VTLDAALFERSPKLCEQRVHTTVHMKGRGEIEQPCDLLGGEVVVESETKQQPVARVERRQRIVEDQVKLCLTYRELGAASMSNRQIMDVQVLADEIP
jgi:hypothetical protein